MKFIYGIIPVPVFYVKDLGKFAGKSNGFFVRIKKGYEEDEGLLEHELQHCRQFYRTLMLHNLLYKFSAPYRYNSELECYRLQLRYAKNRFTTTKYFVKYLTTNYGLNVEPARVEQDLKR